MKKMASSDRATLAVALLSFIAGLASTLVGFINTAISTKISEEQLKNNQIQQVIVNHVKFAETVHESLESLSDPRKASLSIPVIYAIAEDTAEKRIVITIAAATRLADVQRVLTVLVNNDAEARAIAQERDVLALIAPQPSDAASGSKVQSGPEVAAGEAKLHPPDNPQTTLLTALAAKTSGWVYYGKIGSGVSSNDPSECLPKGTQSPTIGQTVTLCSARYLRATEPKQKLGAIIGVVQPAQPLHVEETDAIQLSGASKGSGVQAIWLRVTPG